MCHRMISEALMLYVEGGRVSHSWLMCVVGRGYGELSNGMDGGWYAFEIKSGVWSLVGRYRRTSRVPGDTLIAPDHITFHVCCSR